MKIKQGIIQNQSGFTLVELLIAMVVAMLVSAAVYASYKVQQQTYKVQTQVTEIQQNLRAGMEMMTREMKMAGYDPSWSGEYGIDNSSSADSFRFTADLCEDGGEAKDSGVCPPSTPYAGDSLQEKYQYELYPPGTADDDDTTALRRIPGGPAIAENIEFIEFYYILKNGTGTTNPNPAQMVDVRSVRVTMVARADEPDFKYTNTDTYPLGSGAPDYDPPDDNYRRRSLIRTIELRNMGLI